MYDKLKEITFDGTEYYYNTGKYILVFDPAEGGRIWTYKIIPDDWDYTKYIPYEILPEFIKLSQYILDLNK